MIDPAGRAAIPPAMAAPPPPPPASGATDGLTTAERAQLRMRCTELAVSMGTAVRCDNCEHLLTYPTGSPDGAIAVARRLETYVLGQEGPTT